MTDVHTELPVRAAKELSEQYHKSMVVILSYDPVSAMTHTTTYGVSPEDKETAATVGEQCAKYIAGSAYRERRCYEDFRHRTQAEWAVEREKLVGALLGMFEQYCGIKNTTEDGRRMFDHLCMTAGENAAEVLVDLKIIQDDQLVRG